MLDNIISGNQYKALDKVSDILKNKTTDHIEELKKDFSSKLFNNKNMKS